MRLGRSWWSKAVPAWMTLTVITVICVVVGVATGTEVVNWITAPVCLWVGYATVRLVFRVGGWGHAAARSVWLASLAGFFVLVLGARLSGVGSAFGAAPLLPAPIDVAFDAAWGFLIGVGATAGVMSTRYADEDR